MIIFKYLFFLFVSSIQLLVAEEDDESSYEDIFNQEEQIQDVTENSIHKRNKFIFFKPFKCKKVYFSIVNEVLFMNRLTGFNGYISHFVYNMISLNPCLALLNQIFVLINIFLLMGGVVSGYLFLLSLNYLLEIFKIIIPKVDFLLGYYGNLKFFYRINYDFGMRMISLNHLGDGTTNILSLALCTKKEFNDDNKCIICFDPLQEETNYCHSHDKEGEHHIFHKECIEKWYIQKKNCPLCKQEIYCSEFNANFEMFFYFDLFPEFYVEYSSNNFRKKVKPFLRLLLGGGIHCIFNIDGGYLLPKIHLELEGGITFSNKCEILVSLKPTYMFRIKNFYEGKNFMFDCGVIINFITSFKDGD